ncbi:hypothetical protein HYQ46_006869 [Verticillium longisporum]|nr:hypothetical protein HYQ46_006869 [Verticillium longisporum]
MGVKELVEAAREQPAAVFEYLLLDIVALRQALLVLLPSDLSRALVIRKSRSTADQLDSSSWEDEPYYSQTLRQTGT